MRRSRRAELWNLLAAGEMRNIAFTEFCRLVEAFGFKHAGSAGVTTYIVTPTFRGRSACNRAREKRSRIKSHSSSTWFANTV